MFDQQLSILVIEDDEIISRTIERCLRGHGYRITVANRGVLGLHLARREPPALVLLDVVMPGMEGYAVCREMRSDPLLANVPIVFVTARIRDEDKVAGFQAGADDYLAKPFNATELLLRVQAVLRRCQPALPVPAETGRYLTIGDYRLDIHGRKLNSPRGEAHLTPVQYNLLYHLMSHPGHVFSPLRLLQDVWDYPSDAGSPDLVRVHIKNLRERCEIDPAAPTFIQTVGGHGYVINDAPPSSPRAGLPVLAQPAAVMA